MIANLLGGLTPRQFIEEYWQKKPLLIRRAIPGFTGPLDPQGLFDLACDPDVESRHVRCRDGRWEVARGPQKRSALRASKTSWTVLVQGVNLWLPAADALLHQFDFVPQARLDDLMVSYAVDGGGVGPHFDNYDVFLLQGMGKRRWRIGDQPDRELVEGAPLRILKDFRPTHDWVLEPGDMLYLPPHWAHDGVAIGECMTWSIGFRSPSAEELGAQFLGWLQERIHLEGVYADPDLQVPENSARIDDGMIDQVERMLAQIRWRRADVEDFLGHYLTEPKPHVFFEPPARPLPLPRFRDAVAREGFVLDGRSLLLFTGEAFYLNGERIDVAEDDREALAALAHRRSLPREAALSPGLLALLHQCYVDGFGRPGTMT